MQQRRLSSANFTMQALSLVVLETHCQKCGSVSRSSQGTMLRLEARQRLTLYTKARVNAFEIDLPREEQIIACHVDACSECFEVPAAQATLFDRREQPRREYSLVGTSLGKEELAYLLEKRKADAELRSNVLHGPKKLKAKAEKPAFNVLEIF